MLDLATMLAGPYGATLLGDLGADVIKVESHFGDDSRHLGPERNGERTAFLGLNRNKRGIVLDLQRESARSAFARLLRTTDILITNVREPALSRLELGYEQVCRHRPDIIWIGVTAFGADGPYAGRPGIDFLAQGFAGLLALNGDPAGDPVRVTVPLVDVMTSLLVSTSALAALHARSSSGRGQRIDLSLLDALVHAQTSAIGGYLVAGEIAPRTGNRSQYFAPSGIYASKDGGSVVITCPSEKFFRKLCASLEVGWADDPRFRTIASRLAHADELDDLLRERCAAFPRERLMAKLVAGDVLTAPVNELPDVVRDPQIRHNGMIASVEHARLGAISLTGTPLHLHGTPASVRRAPPVHGQHTGELLGELGYSADEIASLVRDGAAGVAAP